MTFSFWWVWLLFMFIFLMPPIGYGWGYRGWGPPVPRYLQRRRGVNAKASGVATNVDHHAWGIGGDVLWAMMFAWMLLAIGTLFWRGGAW